MKLETLFAEALGVVAPWKMDGLEFNGSEKRLDIQISFERGTTFPYEDPDTGDITHHKAYDTVIKTWRHLNFFEHTCYLHVRTPRIQPPQGGTKLILPPWNGVVSGFTLLFEAYALQLCQHMPIHQAAKLLQTTDHKLWRMIDGYVWKALSTMNLSDMKRLGVDETSLAKGHSYISLFVDVDERKTVFVGDGKDHSVVTSFVELLEDCGGQRNNITDVSCDMSPAFIKGVRESLPKAHITFDKFHILKIINEAVDAVRRSEVRTTPALRGARYALLKNERNLTSPQQKTRQRLSQMNLQSMKALRIREAFQAIYQADSKEAFCGLLQEWYVWATHSRLGPIIKAAHTVKKHWDGIVRWKESLINNGILEGLNSVVQAAKRKARGYKNKHLKIMTYFLTGKLNLHQFNPHLPTRFL
jgi:transposase